MTTRDEYSSEWLNATARADAERFEALEEQVARLTEMRNAAEREAADYAKRLGQANDKLRRADDFEMQVLTCTAALGRPLMEYVLPWLRSLDRDSIKVREDEPQQEASPTTKPRPQMTREDRRIR